VGKTAIKFPVKNETRQLVPLRNRKMYAGHDLTTEEGAEEQWFVGRVGISF